MKACFIFLTVLPVIFQNEMFPMENQQVQLHFLKEFEEELNSVLAAYPSRFESLKKDKHPAKDEWESKIKLENADTSYIERTFGYTNFLALFGVTNNTGKTLTNYKKLAKKIRDVKFTCCSFKEREEEDYILWTVKDPSTGFENLGIEITTVMMVGKNGDKRWATQLKIYNTKQNE